MSFASPLGLLALLVVPAVLVLVLLVHRWPARYPVAFTNIDVLASVIEQRPQWRHWAPLVLLLLALTTAATAVARPRARVTVPEQNATIVLLVDVSGSMRANDVKPSRLDAAVQAMQTFINKLPKQVKVGLVAFSSTAEVLAQPTTDRQAISTGLSYLAPEAGTALGDGVATAVRLVTSSLARVGVRREAGRFLPAAVVLESDGAQNRGQLSPSQAAQRAKAAGVRIDGVAEGTPNGKVTFGYGLYASSIPVPPDPAAVRAVTQTSGGQAFTARTANHLIDVYRSLGSSLGRRRELREVSSWFALITAALLVAAVGLSRAWGAVLP